MHMNSRYESVIPASTRRKSADPKHVALIQGNKPATLEAPAKSDSRRKSKEGEKWRLRGSKGANPRASIGISQRRRVIGASSEQMSEAGSPPADTRRWMDGGREGTKKKRRGGYECLHLGPHNTLAACGAAWRTEEEKVKRKRRRKRESDEEEVRCQSR